ncbi:hypothetical protein ABT158_35615 [Nonomuraea sp. NPDC001636]|uniref:hypothetical protein n=1 Tax=Nonomuraea sp. NPDC001636 TaxID=3154391 RepID=UPI0033202DAB
MALAPIIALKLFDLYGTTLAVSLYVVVAPAVTAVGLAIAPETRDLDIAAGESGTARRLPGQVGPFA